mmetsp:Transcript_19849/g.67222  ORF Transcript_19849/g.67222 Transcript_19849/m.67222 type:complete len:213 (+) Transcript_19849:564-1202(+)
MSAPTPLSRTSASATEASTLRQRGWNTWRTATAGLPPLSFSWTRRFSRSIWSALSSSARTVLYSSSALAWLKPVGSIRPWRRSCSHASSGRSRSAGLQLSSRRNWSLATLSTTAVSNWLTRSASDGCSRRESDTLATWIQPCRPKSSTVTSAALSRMFFTLTSTLTPRPSTASVKPVTSSKRSSRSLLSRVSSGGLRSSGRGRSGGRRSMNG